MSMLLFYVGQKRYACAYDDIVEVLPALTLQPITPESTPVVGLLQYREGLVPVVDFAQILTGRVCVRQFSTRILMMHHLAPEESLPWMGILVERATSIVDVEQEDFISVEGLQEVPYLKGVYTDKDGQIAQVDLLGLLETVRTRLHGGGDATAQSR